MRWESLAWMVQHGPKCQWRRRLQIGCHISISFKLFQGSLHRAYDRARLLHGTLTMLKECNRVLRPGGKLRVSTPDLKFLLDLYEPTKELQRRYIKWSTDQCIPWAPRPSGAFVINNFVRGFGH